MCIDEVHVSTVQGMCTYNDSVSTLLAVVNETLDHGACAGFHLGGAGGTRPPESSHYPYT